MGTILICVAICAGIIIFSRSSVKKRETEHKRAYDALEKGICVMTLSGLRGTVTEATDDHMILDVSPDGTKSLVEFDPEAFYQVVK